MGRQCIYVEDDYTRTMESYAIAMFIASISLACSLLYYGHNQT